MTREASIADRVAKSVVSGNIVSAYDRKQDEILRLIRVFTKQLNKHREKMMSGGQEDTTYLSAIEKAEELFNEMIRKLG